MRPQEAMRLVNKAMRSFYQRQQSLYPALNGFKNKRIIEAVSQLLEEFKKTDKIICKHFNINYEETETYYEESLSSEESVLGQMLYISDRWQCTGRLKFIKRVIELY